MTWLFAAYHIAGLAIIVVAAIRLHNKMFEEEEK